MSDQRIKIVDHTTHTHTHTQNIRVAFMAEALD